MIDWRRLAYVTGVVVCLYLWYAADVWMFGETAFCRFAWQQCQLDRTALAMIPVTLAVLGVWSVLYVSRCGAARGVYTVCLLVFGLFPGAGAATLLVIWLWEHPWRTPGVLLALVLLVGYVRQIRLETWCDLFDDVALSCSEASHEQT